jgi:ABC-2 type transport system permease protein
MMREIRVVMRKELKEIGVEGGRRRGRLTPLVGLAVTGVFFPLNFGVQFVGPEAMMAMGLLLPVLFVLPIVADAFAGERERHTLETLLATRLPDQAILYGKLAAIVAYAFVLTLLALVIGLVSVNVAHPEARPLLIPLARFGGVLLESVLVGTLMTGIGLLISLGAATVRQAQQRFGMVMLVPALIPLIVRRLPASAKGMAGRLLRASGLTPELLLFAMLAVLTAAVLYASTRRFRRSRLVIG